jgi:hypothetical protein
MGLCPLPDGSRLCGLTSLAVRHRVALDTRTAFRPALDTGRR